MTKKKDFLRDNGTRVLINTNYILHKVQSAKIDKNNILRFIYEDKASNKKLMGPFYLSKINGEVPTAEKELLKHGLTSPDEIKYLVAYHCGAFPNGLPICLLRSLDDVPDKYL